MALTPDEIAYLGLYHFIAFGSEGAKRWTIHP